MLLNCGVGEDSWESLGLQGDLFKHLFKKTAYSNPISSTSAPLLHWKIIADNHGEKDCSLPVSSIHGNIDFQSILKEISSEYSLEGLMLKLTLQYFGHLMWRADSLEKTLMLGNIEDRIRQWDGWVASQSWWTWVWASSGSWWRIGKPGVL